jgi:hypothetical protein
LREANKFKQTGFLWWASPQNFLAMAEVEELKEKNRELKVDLQYLKN